MDPPNRLDHWLRRSRLITLYGGRICGTGWLLFMCWTMWTQPERLGPARMVGGLALASATATCTVLWWMSNTMTLWRLDLLARAPALAGHTGADHTALNGTRPHAVRSTR